MPEPRRTWSVARGAAVLAAVTVMAAGCSSAPGSPAPGSSAPAVPGAVATLPSTTGTAASCMFPMEGAQCYSVANYENFEELLVRPLYMFGGNSNSSSSVDTRDNLGPARAPVYKNDGKTVVINFKPSWKWSDGQPADADDLIFFLNMLEAEKANYAGYTPGLLPDNLTSYAATGKDQVTLRLTSAYSSLWFTYNQLAILYPFPLTWDVTSAAGAPDSGGCLTDSAADGWARCIAVWKFLNTANADTSTFATSPLWKVVDGPYKLASYQASGNYTLVPNTSYSGAPKAAVTLKFTAVTSGSAVYAGLRSGTYSTSFPNAVPLSDLPPAGHGFVPPANPIAAAGYTLHPQFEFGIGYAYINYNNPLAGPEFRQLYFRQALAYLTNQELMSSKLGRGYMYPTPAGIPPYPRGQWVTPVMTANGGQGAYAYNPAKAEALLKAHGWKVVSGVLTCESPACGAGVKIGTQARFGFAYRSGVTYDQDQAATLESGWAAAGIQLTPEPEPVSALLQDTVPCHGPACTWDFLYLGGWLYNGPGFEPTGEALYQTGVPNNFGGYSDAQMDRLITATHTSDSLATFHAYATYLARQEPDLNLPWNTLIMAVSKNLHNVTFNPLLVFYPEYWRCSTKTC